MTVSSKIKYKTYLAKKHFKNYVVSILPPIFWWQQIG